MSRIRFFLFIILAATPQIGLKGQGGSISGTIIDARTGEPIVGHSVVYYGTTLGQVTDENGHFELSGLKTGKCEIIIDGNQKYLTLALRSLPLSKKRKAIDLDSIYLSPIDLGYDIVELQCLQFEGEYYPYTVTNGAMRFINGEIGLVNFAKPYEICPELTNTKYELSGSSVFNRFPGGQEGLRNYIGKRTFYPSSAVQNAEAGFSFSSITITPFGTIDNIKIHHSIGSILDNAVIEILKTTDGYWTPDNNCAENQTVYIQLVFDYETNNIFDLTYLDGENILEEILVAPMNYTPPKYQSTMELVKNAQKNIDKRKFDSAISDLNICISRDPFNLLHRNLLAYCFEGAGRADLKAEVESQIQSIESNSFATLFGAPEVFGNIKIFKELNNGTFSITELLRDSTLLYIGKLKSIYPEKKQGKFYFYDYLGNISATGQYEEDIPVGVWTYFNEDQEVFFATNYNKVLNFLLQEETAEFNREPLYISEIMPKFNGGDPSVEFPKYILKSIIYPEYPRIKGIGGRLIVQFMVDYTGKVRNPQVVRGVHRDLNIEVLRVLSESPTWTPGLQRNQPTDVLFTFPISIVGVDETPDSDYIVDIETGVSASIQDLKGFETVISEDNQGFKFEIKCDVGYGALDSPPLFQGQDPGNFVNHIATSLKYPEHAAENGIKGRVVVQFTIGTDGSVGEITLVNSVDRELDREAIRVVKNSPDWVPAKKDGQNVVCYLRYSFNFAL